MNHVPARDAVRDFAATCDAAMSGTPQSGLAIPAGVWDTGPVVGKGGGGGTEDTAMLILRILFLFIALVMISVWREHERGASRFRLVTGWWSLLLPADIVAFAWSMGWLE